MAKFFVKVLTISTGAILFGSFFVIPADAQKLEGPKEVCEINPSRLDVGKFSWTTEMLKDDNDYYYYTTSGAPATYITGENAKKSTWIVGDVGSGAELKSKQWAIICLVDTIGTITGWIFFILMAISVLFVIIAAFLWVTAGAQPENQRKAAQMIIAAIIGIGIAILSRVIPGIVTGLLA